MPEFEIDNNELTKSNKKKTVILHIGMHKTATSSIQETLETNKEILGENNLFYPDLEANHGHALCSVFWENPDNYYLNKMLDKSSQDIREYNSRVENLLVKQLMETTADTIIISGEDLCYLSLQGVKKLKCFFQGIYDNVDFKVVAYFREYLSYIISLVQQSIKTGSYYKQRIDDLRAKKYLPLYYSKVINYINVFGVDAIDSICFEDSCKHKRGPVGYFFSYLDFSEEDIDRLEIKKTNESLSDKAVEVISYINEIIDIENIDINDRFILFNFHVVSGDKFRLDKKTINHVYKITRNDAKWLKNTLDIDYLDSKIIDVNIKPFIYDENYIDEFYEGFTHLTPKYKELAVRFILHKIETEESDNQMIFNKLLAKVSENNNSIVNKMSWFNLENDDKSIHSTMDFNNSDKKNISCRYELAELPKIVSKYVSDIYYKDNMLYVHSTGNDPYFVLPDLAILNDNMSIQMVLDYSVASYIQVFYRSVDEGFSKERSVLKKVDKGTQDMLIKLQHSTDISEIRIDTGGKEGIFIIKELKIYY